MKRYPQQSQSSRGVLHYAIYGYNLPTQFVLLGAVDDDCFNTGNLDTGIPTSNIFNGNISFNASATKIDGLGFDIKNPGTLTLGNGVIVEIK